jgi:hypothetical protein
VSLPLCARFDYDVGPTTLLLTVPQRPWIAGVSTIGGAERAAGGLRASYLEREDELLAVTVRFLESEWPAVLLMIRYAIANDSALTVWLDYNTDPSTSYVCDLVSPSFGARIVPTREDDACGLGGAVMSIDLVLRKTDGTPWTDNYFDV